MAMVAVVIGVVSVWIMNGLECNSWGKLLAMMAIYSTAYMLLSFAISFNSEERYMVLKLVQSNLRGRG